MHDVLFFPVRGVAVSERNAILFDAQDAVVRDGDAMRVGAEIGKHSFGSGERGLRVDDPVATANVLQGLGTEVSSPSFPLSKARLRPSRNLARNTLESARTGKRKPL